MRSGNICVREKTSVNVGGNEGKTEVAMERELAKCEEQWAGIRWKLTFLHAELTPPITPTRRGVLGLHEVLIVLRQTRQRRSALVVTLAPLLFANLHTTRCSARERGAR